MDTLLISRATIFKSQNKSNVSSSQGFTLLELIVVIAILGFIAVIALPKASNILRMSLSSTTREISSAIKQTYNAAMMTKRAYRLVFDIDHREYWVEMGPATWVLETKESLERAERKKKWMSSDALKKSNAEAASAWQPATQVIRKKVSLPQGVEFEDIYTEQSPEAFTSGLAYCHFFPQGTIEKTLIHLKDNSSHFATLFVEPLVGRTRVFQRRIEIKEIEE